MTTPSYEQIYLENIKLHEDLSSEVLSSSASITRSIDRQGLLTKHQHNRLSKHGLLSFIKIHPLHVIKSRNSYKCFAGIRGYQLAEVILPPRTKVNVVIHNSKRINIEQESSVDSLLSSLIFGLDDLAYETDFLNVWKAVDPRHRKKIMPGLNNKSYLETLLKCSRSGLSRNSKKLISLLKKEIDKEDALNDQ